MSQPWWIISAGVLLISVFIALFYSRPLPQSFISLLQTPSSSHYQSYIPTNKVTGGWKVDRNREKYEDIHECELLRLDAASDLAIARRLIATHTPFILVNLTNNWPAYNKWTKEHLLKAYGNRMVRLESESSIVMGGGSVSSSTAIPFSKILALFDQCMRKTEGPSDPDTTNNSSASDTDRDTDDSISSLYCSDNFVFDTGILKSIPELSKDIHVPSLFSNWDNPRNEQSGVIWHMMSIGPSNTGLPFHSHGKTWLTLIFGIKKWLLYPPGYGLPMSYSKSYSPLHSVQHWMETHYENMLAVENRLVPPVVFTSDRKMKYNDHSPANMFRPLKCTQKRGELLYLPDSWLHLTLNVGETIGKATFLSANINL